MDRIRIRGGNQLNGSISISGAKNAALPLMIASLLTPYTLTLANVPRLADIGTMIQLLEQHGVEVSAGPGENGHAHALNSFFSLCACQRMMPTATSTMMIVSTVAMAAP